MEQSRRCFLGGVTAATSTLLLGSCVGPYSARYGHESSYLSRILKPENHNTVFHWMDVAMQQVRDQRIFTPRAAYNFGLATASGFLAANGVMQSYQEPFGIGPGPKRADPEVAYGVAFTVAAAEAFQQPFLFERSAFLSQFPGSESKSLGIEWGRHVGRKVLKMRTNDGSESSEVNYFLGSYVSTCV